MAATQAVPGELATSRPLELVQIDHTKVEVIVAEATSRRDAVRPRLTLAIDVHTRIIVGFYLALHEPSAISVGVCLLNAIFPKSEFLEARRLDLPWPTMGLPASILVDNGSDFRSRAFVRGCREYGIRLSWRPSGVPHDGGHIERPIGTQMNAVHVLPGSTGSSVADRPASDPDVGRVRGKLAVRYDPRDLSRVFVRRPNGHFVEARYRELSNPQSPCGNGTRPSQF